jgi:hypothetical protein
VPCQTQRGEDTELEVRCVTEGRICLTGLGVDLAGGGGCAAGRGARSRAHHIDDLLDFPMEDSIAVVLLLNGPTPASPLLTRIIDVDLLHIFSTHLLVQMLGKGEEPGRDLGATGRSTRHGSRGAHGLCWGGARSRGGHRTLMLRNSAAREQEKATTQRSTTMPQMAARE